VLDKRLVVPAAIGGIEVDVRRSFRAARQTELTHVAGKL
jgi:hypothetical protein